MTKNIKVMQIIPELGLAGAERMVENLSISLRNDGFDVSVVSLYDYHSPITNNLESENIPIFYLNKKKGFDLRIIFKLYKLFKEEKPDIIHTHRYVMPYVIPPALLAKVPIKIHTIHSIAKRELRKSYRKLSNFFYRYCNVIPVSISPQVKNSVIEEYRLSGDCIPMIFNGTDLSKPLKKEKYSISNNSINITHIGRFTEAKNHIGLIKSFNIVRNNFPNAKLRLIGAGEIENKVKEIVKELKLDEYIQFLGLKSDVYPHLNETDIFVLPSLWEGMPITLIEAMATGLPIVVTKVGGMQDMIEDNVTGLVVDVDKDKIAKALIKFISDEDLREKLGTAAMVASQKFSSEKMAEEYEKLYTQNLKR